MESIGLFRTFGVAIAIAAVGEPALRAQNLPYVSPVSLDAGAGRSVGGSAVIDGTLGGFGGVVSAPDGRVAAFVGYPGTLQRNRAVLGQPSPLFSGTVLVPFFGEDDLRYRLQASTLLRTNTWVTLWTGRTVNGVAVIAEPSVASAHHRFYRVSEIR